MSLLKPIDFNFAVKYLRNIIVAQSGLDRDLVLNSDSIQGATAYSQNISELIPPTVDTAFIVFDLAESDGTYGTTPGYTDSMYTVQPYTLHLKIYGNPSHDLAKKLSARFRHPIIRANAYTDGLYIDGVDQIQSVKEFINNVLWPRCDLDVHITTLYKSDSVPGEPIAEYSSITYSNF